MALGRISNHVEPFPIGSAPQCASIGLLPTADEQRGLGAVVNLQAYRLPTKVVAA